MRARRDERVRVAFAGGGTGGHLCPAIAIAQELVAGPGGAEVLFLGSDRPLERRLLEPHGFAHEALPCASPGRSLRGGATFLWRSWRGLVRARELLRALRPHVVVGLGGFPSVPGVLAARALGVPVVLFEPNAVAGRANAALARLAREALVQWEETRLRCRAIRTGTPVAAAVRDVRPGPADARLELGLPADRRTVLVMGGSQGARGINAWVAAHLQRAAPWLDGVAFLHLAGNQEAADGLRAAYARAGVAHRVLPFLDRMGLAYRACDLAVVRGGGATLAELMAVGVPAWVVPLPRSADDHQRANARAFAASGAGAVVEEAELDGAAMVRLMRELHDGQALAGRRDAARAGGRPDAAAAAARRLRRYAALRLERNDTQATASRARAA